MSSTSQTGHADLANPKTVKGYRCPGYRHTQRGPPFYKSPLVQQGYVFTKTDLRCFSMAMFLTQTVPRWFSIDVFLTQTVLCWFSIDVFLT